VARVLCESSGYSDPLIPAMKSYVLIYKLLNKSVVEKQAMKIVRHKFYNKYGELVKELELAVNKNNITSKESFRALKEGRIYYIPVFVFFFFLLFLFIYLFFTCFIPVALKDEETRPKFEAKIRRRLLTKEEKKRRLEKKKKGKEKEREDGKREKEDDDGAEVEDVIPGVLMPDDITVVDDYSVRRLRLVTFDRSGTDIKVITEDDPNESLSFLEGNSMHWFCHRFEVWKWKRKK
jgi:hypothetical protein